MDFHEWWVSEIGHPPANKVETQAFHLCLTAWRVALTHGDRAVSPEDTEKALKRVGQGESTVEDELTLRQRIQVGDETVQALSIDLNTYEQALRDQAAEDEKVLEFMPKGAKHLGGQRWRCPRCNFIGGLRKQEMVCRGCNYPEEDTRDWVKPALSAVPDGGEPEAEDDGGDAEH